ncbi:MAG: LLM class flavin-dependent oxidoreductase [Fibrobacteria bacterium]
MIPISILDLVPIKADTTPGEALRQSLELARLAERLGYRRFWVAEHHNMIGIGSAATSVVIGFLAQGTTSIRVGSGGIMLPNHSPLVIAEQFGTLESLYPGRIDLGLGRAPGTDLRTLRALRRNSEHAENFPRDVRELQTLLAAPEPGQTVQAVPGGGTNVPIWILGSSLFGAQLAAAFGLPYAFASHFAPAACLPALDAYRRNFQPSAQAEKPYAMIGVNVVVADTDAEARRQFTTPQQAFTNILRDTRGYLPPPIASMEEYWSPSEKEQVGRMLEYSVVGSPATVAAGLRDLRARTGADEFMVTAHLSDPVARLRSFELLAEIIPSL